MSYAMYKLSEIKSANKQILADIQMVPVTIKQMCVCVCVCVCARV